MVLKETQLRLRLQKHRHIPSNLDELLAKEMYLLAEKEIVSNKIDTIISTIGLYKAIGGVDLYKLNEKI